MTDHSLTRHIAIAAAISGALAVLLGSFGAHLLPSLLENQNLSEATTAKRINQFDIGVRYHLIHAVALLALAGVPTTADTGRRWAARLFVAGIVFFSGSLYLISVTSMTWLGMVAPVGGIAWIVGWAWLLLVAKNIGRAKT